MFESFRYGGGLSLEAAIRDTRSGEPRTRDDALRQIAGALIQHLGEPVTPSAVRRHPHGPEVLAALRERLEDAIPQLRGLALVGLGQLAQPDVVRVADEWLVDHADDEGTVFRRETAIIALALLGEVTQDTALRAEILHRLRVGLDDARPDVRFQAARAVAELGGASELPRLLDHLEAEAVDEVRGQLLGALQPFDPLEDAALSRIAALVRDAPDESNTGFEGGRRLAAAGRADGEPHLRAALRVPERRDDALEALAVLGPGLDEASASAIRRLADGWLVPPVTRVRAAYALARIHPAEGRYRLERWSRSRRRDVRDAVADAERALEQLGTGGP